MEKGQYILDNGFGGATAWTVDLDDFTNRCCREPFPLLRTLNRAIGNNLYFKKKEKNLLSLAKKTLLFRQVDC